MRFLSETELAPPAVGPLHRDVWRHDWQTWIARYVDANGDQVDDAAYGFRKRDAIANLGSISYRQGRERQHA